MRVTEGECDAGEEPSDFSYFLVPDGERETRRSDNLSAIFDTFVDDRLLTEDGEGDGERERTTEARCGTTTPIEALRSYLDRSSRSSSALCMLKRGSPRGADIGELGAEEGCVAYLDCARFREKMADGFGTASRCGDSRSPLPNLEGERCLAALRGLGEDRLIVGVVGGVSFGGVGLLVGSAILIGDFERAASVAGDGDSDLPAADLGGNPNRGESPPPLAPSPPPPPPPPSPCLRLLDLDLDEASEAAFDASRRTEVTYLTPWLISKLYLQSQVIGKIYLKTSQSFGALASTSSCICQIPVKKMQRVAMTTMTMTAAAGTILPLPPSFFLLDASKAQKVKCGGGALHARRLCHLLRLSQARLSPDKSHRRRNRSVSVRGRTMATPNDWLLPSGPHQMKSHACTAERQSGGQLISTFSPSAHKLEHAPIFSRSNGIRPLSWRPREPTKRYWPARAISWPVSRLPGRVLGGGGGLAHAV